ncbi:ABC transporter ATP-binding protein [Microbulbifer sp. ZKSA004]|uniref:ABC transporter ATP-binding protein n=1 Tax=Microbulbifer sp. ZKSA004 TaxID=3243389 RepID=UPI00403A4B1F
MTRKDFSAFTWYWKYLRPYKWVAFKGVFFLTLAVLLSLLPPLMIKEMVDDALPNKNLTHLLYIFTVLIITLIVIAISQSLEEYYTGMLGLSATKDIRIDLYRHIQFVSNNFFLETKTGEIASRFTSDILNIHRVISKTVPGLFTNSVLLIGAVVIMLNLNIELTLAAISTLPFYFIVLFLIVRKNTELSRKAFNLSDKINGNITDNFSFEGQLHSRVNGLHGKNLIEFSSFAEGIRLIRLKIGLLTRGNESIFHMLSMSGIAIVYLIGGIIFIEGEVSIGTIVAFSVFVTRMYQPLSFFSTSAIELSSALVSMKRLAEYFSIPKENSHQTENKSENTNFIKPSDIAIKFDNVTFSYTHKTERKLVFDRLNLTIFRGSKIAITGANGVGKSTLTQLIAGIYKPQQGTIYINNNTIDRMGFLAFSQNVSIVFSSSFFSNGSILDNLIQTNPDASEDQIQEALLLSESDSFVSELSNGIHTQVGQGGYKLSSGQRQRLALARLFIHSENIVICDEITSNLSADVEQRILRNLLEKLREKTVLFVSHNKNIMQFFDEVITLDASNKINSKILSSKIS